MKEIKVAIAIPLVDRTVSTAFLDSFVMLDKPKYVYLRPQYHGMNIADIRNQLVTRALENDCTHILMIDSDQVFPTNTLSKLLNHDEQIVSAIVHRRYPGFDPILYRGVPGRYLHVGDEEIIDCKKNNKLLEIDATGCGCVLYKTEIFRNVSPPWFEFNKTDNGDMIGEDIGFCHKLKKYGYKIYCDTTIDIGHLSTLEVNWGTYALYNFVNKLQQKEAEG